MKLSKNFVLTVAMCFGMVSMAQAQNYEFRDLRKVAGENSIVATSLSNRGLIGGSVMNVDPESGVYLDSARATLWDSAGRVRRVTPANGAEFNTRAVNNRGDLAGEINTAQGFIAFMWDGGFVRILQNLDDEFSSLAYDINDRRQVVGYIEGEEHNQAFLYREETGMVEIFGEVAVAINNRGQVLVKQGDDGFITNPAEGQRLIQLDALGHGRVNPVDINERGEVLYTVSDSYDLPSFTVIRRASGRTEILPELKGFASTFGNSINDLGEVAGNSCGVGEEGDEECAPFLFSRGRMIAGEDLLRRVRMTSGMAESAAFVRTNNAGDILVAYFDGKFSRAGLLRKNAVTILKK